MSEPICIHCHDNGVIRCDAEHCDAAGPGEVDLPGRTSQCRPCWVRLGKPPVQPPSFLQRARNLSRAMWRWARAGGNTVSRHTALKRLAICHDCTAWFDTEKGICKHPQCGCPMKRKVILDLPPSERCPIGKW